MVKTDLVQKAQEAFAWGTASPLHFVAALVGLVALALLAPFFANWHFLLIPGPLFAKLSDFWLVLQTKRGNRFEVVHELHKKHGKFVRIAPNHISIADHQVSLGSPFPLPIIRI